MNKGVKTKKTLLNFILSIFLAVCVFIIGVYTSIEAVTYDDSFYAKQYEKNHVSFYTDIEPEELMRITDEIQSFLKGERADFNIEGIRFGEYSYLFDAQEIFHMGEVRDLYLTYKVVRNIAVILFAGVLTVCICLKKNVIWTALRNAGLINLVLILLIGLGAALFFDPLFTLFHEIFFDNDLWLFDYTSLLINILTGEFFVAAAVRIIIYHFLFSAVVCVIGVILSRKVKY